MTTKDNLVLELLLTKLNTSKIGVLAKGLRGLDIVSVVNDLATKSDKHIYVAIVGYGINPYENDKITAIQEKYK